MLKLDRYELAQKDNEELQTLLQTYTSDQRRVVNGRDDADENLLNRSEAIDIIQGAMKKVS
jgi:hypothetical protein